MVTKDVATTLSLAAHTSSQPIRKPSQIASTRGQGAHFDQTSKRATPEAIAKMKSASLTAQCLQRRRAGRGGSRLEP